MPLPAEAAPAPRATASATPQPLALTLDQAIALGMGRSLALRSSTLLVDESRALQGLARARFMPKLDLVGLGTYGQVGTDIGFISNLPAIGDLNFELGGDGYAVVQNTFVNVGLGPHGSTDRFQPWAVAEGGAGWRGGR